jgi:hypothetical protein
LARVAIFSFAYRAPYASPRVGGNFTYLHNDFFNWLLLATISDNPHYFHKANYSSDKALLAENCRTYGIHAVLCSAS